MRVAFVFLPPWDPTFPSYAMGLFKASTAKAGHEFVDCDLNIDMYRAASPEEKGLWGAQVANRWAEDSGKIIARYEAHLDAYIERMIEAKIELYAFSINVYSMYIAFWMIERIKRRNPSAAILVGGPQCFPAYTGLAVLDHAGIDAICTGEGDLVWPKVLAHFERTGNLRVDLPGICYRRPDGSIADNGVPEVVRDLDALPFADYGDIDFREYGGSGKLAIGTSRGCVNTCAFCSERPNFTRYRFRSAESIFAEVACHVGRRQRNPTAPRTVPYIQFNDSLVNGVPRELDKLCGLIIDSGLQFRWGGMALIRKEMTRELLTRMARAGCTNLAWGLESGSQRVLALMRKRFFTMDLAKQVIVWAAEAGIRQAVSLIAGFPGETEEMFLETNQFVAEYGKYFSAGMQPMMLCRNSLVHDEPEQFGIVDSSEWLQWRTVDGQNTYEVRLRRVEMLKATLKGRLQTIDHSAREAVQGEAAKDALGTATGRAEGQPVAVGERAA